MYMKTMETKVEYDDCPEWLARYLEYLRLNQGRRPATICDVAMSLRELCCYIHYWNKIGEAPKEKSAYKDIDVRTMPLSEFAELTPETLNAYLCHLETVAKNRSATIRKKLIVQRQFYAYCQRMQLELNITLPRENPFAQIRLPRTAPRPLRALSEVQIRSLLASIKGDTELRDRAILLLLLTTGISVVDLVALTQKDLLPPASEGGAWQLRIRSANRTVFLTGVCVDSLLRYLRSLGDQIPDTLPLFLSDPPNYRFSRRWIEQRISTLGTAAKIEKLSSKVLRNTAAATLLRTADAAESDAIFRYLGYQDTRFAQKRFERSGLTNPSAAISQNAVLNSALSQIGTDKEART